VATAGRGSPAPAQVGGSLKITIDQEGKVKVSDLRSDNPNVNIDVYNGAYMAGGA
jgi:hypothetical protein